MARRACKAPQSLQDGDGPPVDLRGSPEPAGPRVGAGTTCLAAEGQGPPAHAAGHPEASLAPGGSPGPGRACWPGPGRRGCVGVCPGPRKHLPGMCCLPGAGEARRQLRRSLRQALGPGPSPAGVPQPQPSWQELGNEATDRASSWGGPSPRGSPPGPGSEPQPGRSLHPRWPLCAQLCLPRQQAWLWALARGQGPQGSPVRVARSWQGPPWAPGDTACVCPPHPPRGHPGQPSPAPPAPRLAGTLLAPGLSGSLPTVLPLPLPPLGRPPGDTPWPDPDRVGREGVSNQPGAGGPTPPPTEGRCHTPGAPHPTP